jgi:hypothetical protein
VLSMASSQARPDTRNEASSGQRQVEVPAEVLAELIPDLR